jgi:hypothetical protein
VFCKYCGKEANYKLPSGESCCTKNYWECPSWMNNFKKHSKDPIKTWKGFNKFDISKEEKLICKNEIEFYLMENRNVYQKLKRYNIYKTNEGRLYIILYFPNKKTLRRSYPKFLMELYLNKYLNKNNTIHHKDKDFLNNKIDNLEVIERAQHAKQDVVRNRPMSFICPECEKKFILEGRKLHDADGNRQKGKAGPFCSRSCAGKYCQKVQMGMKPLDVKLIKLEKFRLSDEEKGLTHTES